MEEQFKYIADLAKHYKRYNTDPNELFKALNNLDAELAKEIFEDFRDRHTNFYPVIMLRAECARLIMEREELTEQRVEELKEKIRNKDTTTFSYLPASVLETLEKYPVGRRDMFANWQKPWAIFHPFFYKDTIKDTTQHYLEQICKQVISDLDLSEYTYHSVDFYGANNFGSDSAWLALYPEMKFSHKDAYQFFVQFSDMPTAGRIAGHSIQNPVKNIKKEVNSYREVLETLKSVKEEIIKLNQQKRNYFKLAPGKQAVMWDEFHDENVARINFSHLPIKSMNEFKSLEELNIAAGLDPDSKSNQTWNLWLFKNAKVGDVIFASKGKNTCLGVGILDGEYQYEEREDGYNHCRKVKWITNKVYSFSKSKKNNYAALFRIDTFSPSRVWNFILIEYIRLYPELKAIFEKHNLIPPDTPISPEEINYWWLNANPSIWSITSKEVGETETYTSTNEAGEKRRIFKYFQEVKPGDIVMGYESSPVRQIKATYEITKALHTNDKGDEVIEFEITEKFDNPVHWNELRNNPALASCEVFINNMGSLFKLSSDEYDVINEIIEEKNPTKPPSPKYDYLSDPDKPFLEYENFKQIVNLLKRNKNIILQGPPGVGKTFIARKLAYEHMGFVNDSQISMVQFHQSYCYEDFIQGLRPGKNGFELKNGTFYNFCQKAQANPEKSYFFIIDEINRGNLSKIFGELLMLIEADKRSSKFALNLAYAEEETDTFYIPENLYIIGTMNTADRSLAIVDYALRRRFAFINQKPVYDEKFSNFLINQSGLSDGLTNHITGAIRRVNGTIAKDINLGSGFEIGHSYFCSHKNGLDEDQWYNEVLEYEIKPLLEEIWFDNLEQAESMINILKR